MEVSPAVAGKENGGPMVQRAVCTSPTVFVFLCMYIFFFKATRWLQTDIEI